MKLPIASHSLAVKTQTPTPRSTRPKAEDIRQFIFAAVERSPNEVAVLTTAQFGITRQAVNKHLQKLVTEGSLTSEGKTRHRSYKLATLTEWHKVYTISPSLEEDQVWSQDVAKAIGNLAENVVDMWSFCVTEMVNNAIDHSRGTELFIHVGRTAVNTQVMISDNGVGIFKKIQESLGLIDERHAILELSKGKLTTDPEKHTGHGIFFTSRMVDMFYILSGGVYFKHEFSEAEDWILEQSENQQGTAVGLKLNNHSLRTVRDVSEKFSTDVEDLAFTKTVVPVRLAQYGMEKLVSRSQAKRLMTRVDRFKIVMLDFMEVETIGQAFADEIFRIFVRNHPEVKIVPFNTNAEVSRVIESAKTNPT